MTCVAPVDNYRREPGPIPGCRLQNVLAERIGGCPIPGCLWSMFLSFTHKRSPPVAWSQAKTSSDAWVTIL
ncbi:hypothetical protein RRG08_035340 [Elysia crispata]|uniref:Uncharacterized protein n=1 Tax=Elysia crispata TaxID=231223 RepID=A0AAE0Y3H7_9GAST|nr:hypothetical protein RRG08_035340 [Elysia crispata]